MEIYQQNYSILASDMDITYHITPNAIMLYFQDCFARFLTSKRLAAFDIIKENLIWVISDLELNFIKERPLWSSDITVKIRFSEIGSVKIYVDYWICDDKGEAFAEGTSIWAIINSVTKRPYAAKEMLEKGGILANGTPMKSNITQDVSKKTLQKEVEHIVNVTDLDFNGHVCNRTYLSISMATLPLDFIKKYSPSYIHIKFAREAFFGETLTCKVSENESLSYWFDIVNSKGKDICNIYSTWEDHSEYLSKDVSYLINREKTK